MVRFTPKAKESSFPRNHLAMAVVTATISDSAPRPNTRRPAAIIASVPLAAVSAAPRKHRTPKRKVALRVPMRSMTTPPIRTIRMFGNE